MGALTQDEIIANTRTVVQGLDSLRLEHHQILNSLLTAIKSSAATENIDKVALQNQSNIVEEKVNMLKKAIEAIDLAIGEAQVVDCQLLKLN